MNNESNLMMTSISGVVSPPLGVYIDDEPAPMEHPNFIESNTQAISLEELNNNCIVPTFADNTLTISHQAFIAAVLDAGSKVFGTLTPVECRVSHQVNGRIPSALHKQPNELTDNERTTYYQRMAFVSHVATLTKCINNQPVHLCIGGVRSYSEDKLYNKLSPMKFKIFVGWQVRVCSNLCLTCDGFSGTIECMTESDLHEKALELFSSFNLQKEDTLEALADLGSTFISENDFCGLMGRLRLYQALPTAKRHELDLPDIIIGDQACNAAVRGYVENPNFGIEPGSEYISLWQLLQLLNESVKQTYIDKWLDRNQNATDLCFGLQRAIQGKDSRFAWTKVRIVFG